MTTLKDTVRRRIDDTADRLVGLSHRIHAHPALAFEEVRASTWVADALSAAGFEVRLGCYDLPTVVRPRSDPDRCTSGSAPIWHS